MYAGWKDDAAALWDSKDTQELHADHLSILYSTFYPRALQGPCLRKLSITRDTYWRPFLSTLSPIYHPFTLFVSNYRQNHGS